MDGSREYYAKWNKADWERQTPYNLSYIWDLKLKKKHLAHTNIEATGSCQRL